MFRLAIFSFEEKLGSDFSARLRDASADVVSFPPPKDLNTSSYDGAVFLGRCPFPDRLIQPFLFAGKHVLLGTPLYRTSEQLHRLAESGEQHRAQLVVANPDRYLPSRQLVKQQVDSGKLGEIGLLRIHRWSSFEANDHIPHESGVPATMLADIDLTLWLFNKQPSRVYSVRNLVDQESAAVRGDNLQVHLGFPGGGMALIDNATSLPAGDGYQTLSIIGSSGAAYIDDHQNTQLLFGGGQPQGILASERTKQAVNLVQEFVDGLKAKQSPSNRISEWQEAERVGQAICKSFSCGQAVHLEAV